MQVRKKPSRKNFKMNRVHDQKTTETESSSEESRVHYVGRVGLDKDIETLGKSCEDCHAVKSNPTAAPLHLRVWPDASWTSIHVVYAGLFLGKMFVVVVDAHSKWPEVQIMNSTTSQSMIEALRTLFGRYELPI